MVRRATGLATVFTLVAGACSGPAPTTTKASPTPYSTPSSIAWKACGGVLQCGTVTVPVDYSNLVGDTIEIALIRKPATDAPHRIGSVLINPGGPGGSGIDYLRRATSLLESLNKRLDLVSFDPRGVGQSAPIRCISNSQADSMSAIDPVVDDPHEKQALIQADRDYARACRQRAGKILPFVDTASAAKDMDVIRSALGDAKLTYLGFSYGTFLGETYAHLFPTHVRALALDAVVDPAESLTDRLLQRSIEIEANLQRFFAFCNAGSCQFGASGDPAAKLSALMQRLDSQPLVVGKRGLTRSLAMIAVEYSLAYPQSWNDLQAALSAADDGNGQLLLALADAVDGRLADGSYTNTADASVAINCIDQPVPFDIASYDQLGPALVKVSPLFGPVFQYAGLACSYWPMKPKRTIGPLSADGAPPILLVAATEDTFQSYSHAQAVNQQLAGSVLLTRNGYGHPSYDKSDCVRLAVNLYLTVLAMPAVGTVCDSDLPWD